MVSTAVALWICDGVMVEVLGVMNLAFMMSLAATHIRRGAYSDGVAREAIPRQ